MLKISTDSKKDVFIHFGILTTLLLALFFGFFFVYLPWSTNHGETITVPNLKGLTIDQMEDLLDERNLEYEVTDSTFTPGVAPLTILKQYPLANSKVKQGRKIYLTINTETAPMIRMPKLTEMSVRSAEQQLLTYGLVRGNLKYVPDLQQNVVLEVQYEGKKIEAGTLIAKGSSVDLVVGSGTSDIEVDVPDVMGKTLEEAELIIKGSGLERGSIIYDGNSTEPAGTIIRQNPESGDGAKLKGGEVIDLWIAGNPPNN